MQEKYNQFELKKKTEISSLSNLKLIKMMQKMTGWGSFYHVHASF